MVMKFFAAFIVAFVGTLILGVPTLKLMTRLKAGQNILSYVDNHKNKSGTPTIGGVMFLIPIAISAIAFGYKSKMTVIAVLVTLAYAIIGFIDDFLKLKHKENLGLKAYQKIIAQLGIAIIAGVYCWLNKDIGGNIILPFSDNVLNIGYWIIPLAIVFYIATTNSTNLIDGIDGLASGVTGANFAVISIVLIISALTEQNYGNTLYAEDIGGLSFMAMSCFGGVMAFSLFNTHPAKIFMGDTGSLALGGAIASLLAFSSNIMIIFTIGLMLIVTSLSVIIQVIYFKLSKGKRVWKMTPIHHHYQYKGMSESRIVSVYTAITCVMGIICLMGLI